MACRRRQSAPDRAVSAESARCQLPPAVLEEILHITQYLDVGSILRFSHAAALVHRTIMRQDQVWEDVIQRYFRVTLSNPPLIPSALTGWQKLKYLTEFDQRNLNLMATPTPLIYASLVILQAASSPPGRYRDFRGSQEILNPLCELANELAQRGENQALRKCLQFSSAPLRPGQVIYRYSALSPDELRELRALEQRLNVPPRSQMFPGETCLVENIVNGMVCLRKNSAFGLPAEGQTWAVRYAEEANLLSHHEDEVLILHAPTTAAICVRRADVRWSAVAARFGEDEINSDNEEEQILQEERRLFFNADNDDSEVGEDDIDEDDDV
eukprot:gb/GFBE01031963.1/.p1 GENE.gb/GFBE01031963.1/~~gb/GFBE01031963.1/.p1  ORF type:complete len:327 (+),score=35.39 gb/GFBE01031963.1/:1-981(+)